MGKTMMGSTEHKGNVNLLSPEQQNFLSSVMSPANTQAAGESFNQLLQPFDPAQFQDMFQKSFVDPAQQTLQRQIIPGIKEQFMGMDESGSSALNQALAQSATDVSGLLGSQYMNQYNQQQGNLLSALGLVGNLQGQRNFEPMIQQRQGLAGPMISAAGSLGGGLLGGGLMGGGPLSGILGKGI